MKELRDKEVYNFFCCNFISVRNIIFGNDLHGYNRASIILVNLLSN